MVSLVRCEIKRNERNGRYGVVRETWRDTSYGNRERRYESGATLVSPGIAGFAGFCCFTRNRKTCIGRYESGVDDGFNGFFIKILKERNE